MELSEDNISLLIMIVFFLLIVFGWDILRILRRFFTAYAESKDLEAHRAQIAAQQAEIEHLKTQLDNLTMIVTSTTGPYALPALGEGGNAVELPPPQAQPAPVARKEPRGGNS